MHTPLLLRHNKGGSYAKISCSFRYRQMTVILSFLSEAMTTATGEDCYLAAIISRKTPLSIYLFFFFLLFLCRSRFKKLLLSSALASPQPHFLTSFKVPSTRQKSWSAPFGAVLERECGDPERLVG